MSERSLSQKIVRNTFFNALGRFWGILVSLALIPYIVHRIGTERFGIFAVVGAVTGYFGLLDFGIGSSFVKYISEFYARKEYEKINELINTGFMFYFALGVCIIISACLFIHPLLGIFRIPAHLYNEAKFTFILGIAIFAAANASSAFSAVIIGLQRMDVSNKISIMMSLCNMLGTIFVLENKYGLIGLMVNNSVILIITSICTILFAFRILRPLRIDPSLFRVKTFKKMFFFGIKLQIANLADTVSFGIDRILISRFLNLGLVGFYQLGSTVAFKVRDVCILVISAMLPVASELESVADFNRIRELYNRSYKYIILVAMPLMAFVVYKSRPIMLIWVGPGYEYAIWTLRILAVGYLLNLLGGPAATIGVGIARPDIQMKAALAMVVLNVTLSVLFIIKFGFFGVVVATTVALVAAHIFHLILFHRYIKVPLLVFWRKAFVRPLLACVVSLAPIAVMDIVLSGLSWPLHRLRDLSVLAIEGTFFIFLYLWINVRNKYIDAFDVELLRKVPFLNNFLRSPGR